MYLVTGEQMASIDRRTIKEYGIPGYTLMESAGEAVMEQLVAEIGDVTGERAAILCGRGNNGGDGFVVARLLRDAGAQVDVYLFGVPEDIDGDAKTALDAYLESGGELVKIADNDGVKAAASDWVAADVIVDALLGTGATSEIRGPMRTAIEVVRILGVPVMSIDVPSGVHAGTGQELGAAIQATKTVTFDLPKIGHAFYPGKGLTGTLHLAEIGFPAEAIDAEDISVFLATLSESGEWLPQRSPTAHKGDCGSVFVLAGSVGLTGAAALTCWGALRAGAGLVTLGCPKSLNDILEVKVTEAMTVSLPEVRTARCLSTRAVGDVRRLLANTDVVATGPGLGRHRETMELVRRLLGELNLAAVIDADALFALSPATPDMFPNDVPIVLTPHVKEASRLLNIPTDQIVSDPISTARDAAVNLGVTFVLKGAPTVTADPSGEVWVNTTGNAGMATGGCGDLLTGTIAALLGQGATPAQASRLAVLIHGKAGDMASENHGENGLIATDLLNHIGPVMRNLPLD